MPAAAERRRRARRARRAAAGARRRGARASARRRRTRRRAGCARGWSARARARAPPAARGGSPPAARRRTPRPPGPRAASGGARRSGPASRRSAAPYQRAAVAGVCARTASPAARSTATAPSSPCAAENSHVVGELLGRRAAALERGRHARVGGEPPAAAGALVDRAAHERVAERELARDPGLAHEPGRQQAVEQLERLVLAELGGGRREVGLERVARDRRALEQPPRLQRRASAARRRSPPRPSRAGDRPSRRRARAARRRTGCRRSRAAPPRAARRGRRCRSARAPRPGSSGPRSIRSTPPSRCAAPSRSASSGGICALRIAIATSTRAVRRAPQQREQQLDRGRVGVVHVVERQHERLASRRAVRAARAPRGARGSARPPASAWPARRGRRRRGRRRASCAVSSPRRRVSVERAQVLVERVDERAVGQLALELGGPPAEHEHPARAGVLLERAQQPRLADPGLAGERDDRGRARLEFVERAPEDGQFPFAPDHRRDPLRRDRSRAKLGPRRSGWRRTAV